MEYSVIEVISYSLLFIGVIALVAFVLNYVLNRMKNEVHIPIRINEIDLRDRFAISYPSEHIPQIQGDEAIKEMCDLLDYEIDVNDPMSVIELTMKYEAFMRYKYADVMMEQREKHER